MIRSVNLHALPDVCEGLEVEFPEELPPAQRKLMDKLGVKIVVRSPETPEKDERAP
jgi:hypothetical protein